MCTSSSVQPILVLLGKPVAGNPTQFMMERAFARHEIDWRYLSLEVAPEGLSDAVKGVRAMGFRGGNCAEPHKQSVLSHLDRSGEVAQRTGLVNWFGRDEGELVGENTEGRGLLEALRRQTDPAGKRVVLLGAGRMARTVGVELALAKAAQIDVVDRNAQRGQELVELISGQLGVAASYVSWESTYAIPPEVDVLISAISGDADNAEEPLPLNLEHLARHAVVADTTYNPPRSWLLHAARERGAATIDGLEIFVEQAAINFRLWTGVEPDSTAMREAVEEFLGL